MIEIKNLYCGYGKNTVLSDVSACFEKGKLTCIVGANGSGKSTLLKALIGILPTKSGQILVDGTPLSDISHRDIAKKTAYLAQGKSTPNMTVEQLVLHGRFPHLSYPRRYSDKDKEIAAAAMLSVGITEYIDAPLYMLSGGMRQNAYIAMALAQDTDYILFDEPTTYLDAKKQIETMKLFCRLCQEGKGVVTVMHDLPLAMTFSDRVVVLKDGRVAFDGTPQGMYEQKVAQKVFGISIERLADRQVYFTDITKII